MSEKNAFFIFMIQSWKPGDQQDKGLIYIFCYCICIKRLFYLIEGRLFRILQRKLHSQWLLYLFCVCFRLIHWLVYLIYHKKRPRLDLIDIWERYITVRTYIKLYNFYYLWFFTICFNSVLSLSSIKSS